VAVVFALAVPASAQESVYKKGLKSTVWVVQPIDKKLCPTGESRSASVPASGSVIDAKQKLILTNYHVSKTFAEATICFPQFDKQQADLGKQKYSDLLSRFGIKAGHCKGSHARSAIISASQRGDVASEHAGAQVARTVPSQSERVHSIGSRALVWRL